MPIIRLSHLTPEQVRAYRIADNRLSELSGWDDELLAAELHALNAAGFDLGLTGFEGEDLDRLLAPLDEGDGLAGEDVIPEPPVNPVSRVRRSLAARRSSAALRRQHQGGRRHPRHAQPEGDLVRQLIHPIWSTTTAPTIRRSRAGRTRTRTGRQSYAITWDDASQGPELYEGFIKAAIEHAILPNAAWYCWHASRRQAMVEGVWEKFGAFVHQQIVWAKDRGILTRSYYLWQHEPCFFGWLKGNKPPRVSDDYPSTIWNIPTVKVGEKTDHPTSKPIEVFAIPMRQHARPGEVCYEPFSGSGSQIIAGETTGRRVYAIEISPQYVDVAVGRWQTATGKQPRSTATAARSTRSPASGCDAGEHETNRAACRWLRRSPTSRSVMPSRVLTQILVFPIFGLQVSLSENLAIGAAFTADLPDAFVLAAKTVRGVPELGSGDDCRRAQGPAASTVLRSLSLGLVKQPSFEVVRRGHAVGDGLAEAQRSGLADVEDVPSGRFRVTYLRLRLCTIVPRPVATRASTRRCCRVGFGIVASVTRPAGRCVAALGLLRGDGQPALLLQRAGEGAAAGVRGLPAGGGDDLGEVAPSGRRSISISSASLVLSRGPCLD